MDLDSSVAFDATVLAFRCEHVDQKSIAHRRSSRYFAPNKRRRQYGRDGNTRLAPSQVLSASFPVVHSVSLTTD